MEQEGSQFLVQALPTLWRFLVIPGYGTCYKGRFHGCTWLQISKRVSELVWKYWGKCQEPDCQRPGMHKCVSGSLICCQHAFRFGYHHQRMKPSETTCICTLEKKSIYTMTDDYESTRQAVFDPLQRSSNNICVSLPKYGELELGEECDYLNICTREYRVAWYYEESYFVDYDEFLWFLYEFSEPIDIRIRIKRAFYAVKEKYQMLLEEWLAGHQLDYRLFEKSSIGEDEYNNDIYSVDDDINYLLQLESEIQEEERLQKRQK